MDTHQINNNRHTEQRIAYSELNQSRWVSTLSPYRGSAPEVNDIVTFMLPNKPGHVMVKRIARTEDAGVSYIMLGDNLNDSEDSRHFGAVPHSSIRGKVVRTVDALKH